MTANQSTPTEGQGSSGIDKSKDAETIDHLIIDHIDEARRRDVDEETLAKILRHHAETIEAEGFDPYDPSVTA